MATVKRHRDKEQEQKDTKFSGETNTEQRKQAGDVSSMVLLLLLYTLQGIPLGLCGSIPFLLQGKVGYTAQAEFSLVSWPFSLKLLWAPFVDSIYSSSFGRRKSWLVPVQLLVGISLIVGSSYTDMWLGEHGYNDGLPDVTALTMYFLAVYFLMATQDIAVDGWALTMLSKKRVPYASTCNTVGQTLGYFVAYVGFLALNDPSTCNAYFRTEPSDLGLVSLSGFMSFWGYVFLFTTVALVLKYEAPLPLDESPLSIKETFHHLYGMIHHRYILLLTFIQLTCKIGFAAAEAVAPLKLVEYGLPKEKLALMTPFLLPLGLFIPVVVSKGAKERPLEMFLNGVPLRLLVGIVYAAVVWWTPIMIQGEGVPLSYYTLLFGAALLHEVAVNMMFVAVMSFYARVSDPRIGGTYMTYLNTVTNLGSKWPNSVALFFVDSLSLKQCLSSKGEVLLADCESTEQLKVCQDLGGSTKILRDGYFVEVAICTVIGFLWLIAFSGPVRRLQNLKLEDWRTKS